MPDAKVYANDRSILQAGDGLSQASATPDVCKTPGPSGPTPVPYPNVAHDSDLAQGSKSVRIGGKSVAIEGANLRTSTGDEAGTAGGGVFSNKIKGKLTWLGGSPNVSFEGKSVIRFGDTCLHNGNASNGGGQPNAGKLAPGTDKCGHVHLRRVPAKGEWRLDDEMAPGDGDLRRLEREFERAQREKERAKRRLEKAIAERRSERVVDELVEAWKGLIGRCNGLEWELLVGHDVDAREMNIKIVCEDCHEEVTEFDVVLSNGIVKECKNTWDQLTPKKIAVQIRVLEQLQALGPGHRYHAAIPKGERGRLDRKFCNDNLSKDDMRGRIQEH